jgi:aspartate aminotransferase-like enzyme
MDEVSRTYDELTLFTPGPVNVPPRVLAAGARPMLHHRGREFSQLVAGVAEQTQRLFGTKQDVLLVHTTGRGAMEGAILNLFSPGDEIISIANGFFGEMFAEIAGVHGLTVHKVCSNWLEPLNLQEIKQALESHPEVKAITACQCETATACITDIQKVAALARSHGKLTIVDCVSSAGCMPIEFDEWGLDVLITASQKGLMCPTGLSMVVLSDLAWKAVDQAKLPTFYIRFRDIQKNLRQTKETPGSTPVSLVASMNESLAMIMEEGKESCYARHEKVAAAVRAGLSGMGLALFPANAERRSPALTAFQVPQGLTSKCVCNEIKSSYGLVLTAGLGNPYNETVVRIGHMGCIYPKDALLLIAALEATLLKLGHLSQPGTGVTACIRELLN